MTIAAAPVRSAEEFRVVAAKDESRRDVFCVLLKRTYDIRAGGCLRAEKDRPLDLVDIYFDRGDPETCSVRFENDLSPYKTATDVVVVGNVYVPGGQKAQTLRAAVEVGDKLKIIQVFGDRRCSYNPSGPPTVTEPMPFTSMPMQYERAYGGTDQVSIPDFIFAYPRNHLGRGFVLKNSRETVEDLLLPNFEDPSDLLTPDRIIVSEPDNWWKQPMPQGFGWFARTAYPRCSFVGSVPGFVDPDVVVREEQLGLVPARQFALARRFKLPSFDIRFNNGASPGLAVPFLRGGEQIRLAHLSSAGNLAFRVPYDKPRLSMDIGSDEQELPAVLHTVLIRPDDNQVDLVWRGALQYPGIDWLPEMTRLHVEIA